MSAALVVAFLGLGLLVLSFAIYSGSPLQGSTLWRVSVVLGVLGLAGIAAGIIIAGAVIASALFHL